MASQLRRKLKIAAVQHFDLVAQLPDIRIVDDDVISDGQALFARGLCRQYAACLAGRTAITRL